MTTSFWYVEANGAYCRARYSVLDTLDEYDCDKNAMLKVHKKETWER